MSDRKEDNKSDVQHLDYNNQTDSASSFVYEEGTEAERRLLRKIDIRMLPLLWVIYCLNYMDRTNIGNARSGGMGVDLKLTSNDYAQALDCFFITYVLGEIPANLILSRSKPSVFLATIMFLWGSVTIAYTGINNLATLTGLRVLLGILEAGFFPGVLFLMSEWYKPVEAAKRFAFFYTASIISGAFSGILAGVIITSMNTIGGLAGWKWLFCLEGIATVAVSVIAYYIIPDWPHDSKFLTEDERTLAVARLNFGRKKDQAVVGHWDAFKLACKDYRMWTIGVMYTLTAVGASLGYFLPTLTTSLGYTGRMVQFMCAPIYVCAAAFAIATAWNSDRTQERGLHMTALAGMATISWAIPLMTTNKTARYAALVFASCGVLSWIPLWPAYIMEILAHESREKRAVALALINSLGNCGTVAASFTWPTSDAPNYKLGFGFACGSMAAVTIGSFTFYYYVARHAIASNRVITAELEKKDTYEKERV